MSVWAGAGIPPPYQHSGTQADGLSTTEAVAPGKGSLLLTAAGEKGTQ